MFFKKNNSLSINGYCKYKVNNAYNSVQTVLSDLQEYEMLLVCIYVNNAFLNGPIFFDNCTVYVTLVVYTFNRL